MLMIAVLIAALCCGMAGAETVNASLDDLAILQKSKKSELDSFSYTYSVDGQTITVNTANLPEEWSNIKAIYSFYDSHEERSFKEEIELSSSDRQNWTGEIPSYVIEENGEFYAISAGYYNNITCLSEEVWLNEHTLVDWHLQDDSTYETLEYSDNIYTYFPDESTNRRYYYNTDHQLTSIRIIKDSDDYRDYTYSADGSIKKIIAWFDDEPYIYQPSAGWMNNENEPVTPPANANAILADAAQVFSGITIIPASSAEVIANGTCGADGDNLTWTLDSNGLLTISGEGAMADYGWGSTPWYSQRELILSVVIENGVTTIGDYAFDSCSDLTSIVIPDTVTSIGSWGISYCSSLADIAIPETVTSIGYEAFGRCKSLTSIILPSGLTTIAEQAFSGCSNLTNIIIPKGIERINDSAFYACKSLTGITIPDSVTYIGESAFADCTSLTSIVIPNGVTRINHYTFENCTSLASITIPNSVTYIENHSFSNCSSITDIYYTGTEADWAAITIGPNGSGIPTSTNIHYNYQPPAEIIDTGSCGDNLTWALDSNGLLTVSGTGAMADYDDSERPWGNQVTSAVIEDGVTSIGDCAFYECDSMESVTIPNSVTSIGYSAFSYCYALTDLTIPNSVVSIGNYAFAWTDSLTSVMIPASVTSIGNGAFAGSTGLTAILVADDNSNYTSVGGVLYNKSATQLIAYPCAGSVNYTIPDGVTGIGSDAFGCCYSLVSVTIPDSVTSIGNGAFSACNNLRDIYYSGTEAEWGTILIGTYNEPLASAIVHYVDSTPSQLLPPTIFNVVHGTTIGTDVSAEFQCSEDTVRGEIYLGYINESGDFKQITGSLDFDYSEYSHHGTIDVLGLWLDKPGTYQLRAKAYTWDRGDEPSETIADSDWAIYGFTLADTELPTITVELSATEGNYGELTSVTYSIPGVDRGAMAKWTYSEYHDGVDGHGVDEFTPSGTIYLDIGRNEITFYGFLNGVWSKPNVQNIIVHPLGVLDAPTVTYQGQTVDETLALAPTDALTFEVVCENALSIYGDVTTKNSYGYTDWIANIDIDGSTGSFDLSNNDLEPGTYYISLHGEKDWNSGWDYYERTITLYIIDATACGPNLTWTLDSEGLLTISGTGPMYNFITEVPNNPPWRWNSAEITAIEIAEGVTTIGDFAFRFATNMNEISIPVSVTSIGDNAFQSCLNLGVISYAGSKSGWYDITIGSGNEDLTEAYLECAIATPDLPWTFSNGTLTISGNGMMPDYEAYEYEGEKLPPWFEHRNSIQSVVIENGVTSIGECAFYGCPALTAVTMADSVKRIGPDAFRQCNALTSVHFSGGLTDIGDRSFIDCSGLTAITLPASLKSIGFIAFANCGLTSISVSGSTATHHFFYSEETGFHLYHINLPSAVTYVGEAAFYGNALTYDRPDFVLPTGVTAIEAEAFSGIAAKYVWLPDDITSIGSKAFADSTVSYVYIPDGCDNIAADAFPDNTVILVGMNYYYYRPGSAKDYAIENGYDYVVLENPFGGNG